MTRSRRAALHQRRSRRDSESGAAAVEFALVLPVLMALMFGIIECGLAFAQTSSLANGARQGARYGVVNLLSTHSCGDVIDQVRKGAVTIGMREEDVAVTVAMNSATVCTATGGQTTVEARATAAAAKTPCTDASKGLNNTLNVTASYATHIGIPFAFERDVTLTGKGAYRCEYS